MLTNIQSLFADILQSPEQRALQMRNEGVTRAELATRNLSGGGQLLAPLIAAQAQNAPMIEDMIRRGFGGLFGQDTRTESERVQGMLSQSDQSTPEGQQALLEAMRNQGYGAQAAQYQQMMLEQQKADEDRKLQQERTQTEIELRRMQTAGSAENIAASRSDRDAAEQKQINDALAVQERRRASVDLLNSAGLTPERKMALEGFVNSGAFDADPTKLLQVAYPNGSDRYKPVGNKIFDTEIGDFLYAKPEEEASATDVIDLAIKTIDFDTITPESASAFFNAWNNAGDNAEAKSAAFGLLERAETGRAAAAKGGQDYLRNLTSNLTNLNSISGAVASAKEMLDTSIFAAGQPVNVVRSLGSEFLNASLLQANTNLKQTIDQITASVAFDRLQKMRDESPTGGALGNVSNIELGLLSASLGALTTEQNPDLLRGHLDDVLRHYQNVLNIETRRPLDIDWDNPAFQGRYQQLPSGEIATRDQNGNWIVFPY